VLQKDRGFCERSEWSGFLMHESLKTPLTVSASVHCAWVYNSGNITPKVLDFLWQYPFLTWLDPYLTLKVDGIPV